MRFVSNHPKALPFLFLTEMWERFGFYVVQGLLILYLTEYFGYTDNDGYVILGVFSALVYISPFLGGLLADKFLGFETAIIWGGLFLIAGYTVLALPFAEFLFYPALATIIVGNGLFKPNISSILGTQYELNDPRRESGFTIFYIGINLGIVLAGISSGYIKDHFGWHVSLALASVGLILGLFVFLAGIKRLTHTHKECSLSRTGKRLSFVCFILAIGILTLLLRMTSVTTWLLPCTGIGLIIFMIVLTLKQDPDYRKRLLILNILILFSTVFWAIYLQMFFSATLFIDRLVEKSLFGYKLTTTNFYASESIYIILLGPLFAWGWHALSQHNRNPSPTLKFVFAMLFAGFGFLALSLSTQFPNAQGLVNPLWVFFGYLMITIGELLLSPIGLSAVTMLAPPHLTGMMMGTWFGALGFGGIFAGMLAKFASVPETIQLTTEKLAIYEHAFMQYTYIAFGVGLILFLVHCAVKNVLKVK